MEQQLSERKQINNNAVKAELSSPVPFPFLEKIFTRPYYHELLYYRLLFFYKADGVSRFAEHETLTEGEQLYIHVPTMDGKEKSLYEITKLYIHEDSTEVILTAIKPSPKGPPPGSKLINSYTRVKSQNNNEAKDSYLLSISLDEPKPNPFSSQIGRMISTQVVNRMKNLVLDFDRCLNEYLLAGAINIERSSKENFNGSPYSISTKLEIFENIRELFNAFNSPKFIKKILHSTSESIAMQQSSHTNSSSNKLSLQDDDMFEVVMNNMKFHLTAKPESVKENVQFRVIKCADNTIQLLSNPGILNFYQYGISFDLKETDSAKTTVNIKIYYNTSNSVAWAKSGVRMVNRFLTFAAPANTLPEMDDILFIRMRSMLDFTVRHMCRYVTENLQQVEIKPSADEETDLSHESSLKIGQK